VQFSLFYYELKIHNIRAEYPDDRQIVAGYLKSTTYTKTPLCQSIYSFYTLYYNYNKYKTIQVIKICEILPNMGF